MMDGRRVLGLIPARGGSKGIPGKNIIDLGGKPLIAWTIEAGLACPELDRLVLSSDDATIMDVARQWGCDVPFQRPAELATDSATAWDAVAHTLDTVGQGYDYLVLLQPTSPFRSAEDISACLRLCIEQGAPACVSVLKPKHAPHWMFTLQEGGRMAKLVGGDIPYQRQKLPEVYALNGAVYVAQIDYLRAHRGFFGPETHAYVMGSSRSVDIDTPEDLLLARAMVDLLRA
uniref:N-acylneuraminate cytidylyltransferase n=1 Tax=Magnetococcus massalia (strain MO-1) TaxID=451514 RepID=A0A1S7LMF5_MAGMO|nr:Conserved protein of unknown function. putative acylneuraminate cytidylyltransferase [Candidatus Magnetococcus massalia]